MYQTELESAVFASVEFDWNLVGIY